MWQLQVRSSGTDAPSSPGSEDALALLADRQLVRVLGRDPLVTAQCLDYGAEDVGLGQAEFLLVDDVRDVAWVSGRPLAATLLSEQLYVVLSEGVRVSHPSSLRSGSNRSLPGSHRRTCWRWRRADPP